MSRTVSHKWVYERLICEFRHWDVCLDGLIDWDGEKWFCKICDECMDLPADDRDDNIEYNLIPFEWTEECEDYMNDYKKAYKHWCYKDGNRMCSYDNWDLSWFWEKWDHRNPIREQAGVK